MCDNAAQKENINNVNLGNLKLVFCSAPWLKTEKELICGCADLVRQRAVNQGANAPRPQQRRVEQVWPTGGRNHPNSLQRFYAIHLGQKLVHHPVCHSSAIMSSPANT